MAVQTERVNEMAADMAAGVVPSACRRGLLLLVFVCWEDRVVVGILPNKLGCYVIVGLVLMTKAAFRQSE